RVTADQPAQRFQIPLGERIDGNDFRSAAFRLRGLEQHRQPAEPGIVDEAAERFEAETSPADVLVPADPASQRLFVVVKVKQLRALEADQPAELVERLRVAFWGADIVAGGEQM